MIAPSKRSARVLLETIKQDLRYRNKICGVKILGKDKTPNSGHVPTRALLESMHTADREDRSGSPAASKMTNTFHHHQNRKPVHRRQIPANEWDDNSPSPERAAQKLETGESRFGTTQSPEERRYGEIELRSCFAYSVF